MATGTLARPLNTKYERQWNEAEAIRSIFYDEFEEAKFPWKSDHPPHFTIHLNEIDLNGSPLLLDLEIGMIEGYPDKCPPEIKLMKKKGLTMGQMQTINERLQKKAQDLVGTEMVFDLVDEAKTLLSGVAKKKVSFHDEMVTRRAADEQQVKAAQREKQAKINEAELAKRQAAAKELDELVRKELEAKEKLLQTAIDAEEQLMRPVSNEQLSQVAFVPELVFPINGTPTTVQSVNIRTTAASTSWLFGDVLSAVSENGLDFSLVLVRFVTSFYAGAQGKRKLEALVRNINETAKGLPEHSGLVRVLGAQIEYSGSVPVLQVLTEPLAGTRIDHVLTQAGSLNVQKSLKYLWNLLDSLGHLHANGVVHRDVKLRSLYVSKDGSMVNLAFPFLSRALLDLDQVHPISNVASVQDESLRPPEALSKSNMSLGRKADIWSLSVLLLQLLLGPDCLAGFESALEAIDAYASSLPDRIVSFLRRLADSDPARRPLVSELMRDQIFNKDSAVLPVLSYEPIVRRPSPAKGIFDKRTQKADTRLSRYKSDFEEIQFLGKGAFGAVIKVRNRIDNRYYAVKRIKLDKRNAEENQKILREVTTLSRLHHDRIIRYYQAWIEGQGDERPDSPDQRNQESMNSAMAAISFRSYSDTSTESTVGEENNTNWLDSTYNEDSNVHNLSNSSLLDLAINHTGFSDTESTDHRVSAKATSTFKSSRLASVTSFTDEDSEESTESINAKLSGNGPFLYIQMEYCPNQTLRDFIDEGLLEPGEVWRLFRQLLEGLAYIHSQGMIHRDLKPSNIFLDSNGDIKIGDFGLAVADAKQLEDEAAKPVAPTKSGISLTGAVGTPFYMSPEQEKEGISRYTNKVDMYSAGIIFVELVCGHFATTMERIEMLRAVRRSTIDLPPVFLKPENSKAQQIAMNLLAHDPKARLSADELLKRADLIPPKMEDESIKEAIRSLTLPGNPHYRSLVQALFSQTTESFKDFVFDLQAGVIQDPNLLAKISKITARLAELWTSHGAIELSVPLLMPATSSRKSSFEEVVGGEDTIIGFKPVTMLDSFGSLVNLPLDLTTPFARFVAHNRIVELRRFSFDRVYKPNPTGGQPRQTLEGTFDIVHPHGEEPIHEAHVIKTAFDSVLLNVPKNTATSVVLHISSSELVCAVAKACGIETAKQSAFLELAARTHGLGWIRRRNMFSSLLSLTQTSIDSLARFQKPVLFEKLQFLLKQEASLLPVSESIQQLLENLSSYGIDSGKVYIDPLFCLPPEKYIGVMFYISYHPDKKIAHMLAYGGRYDRLVESYAYPRITETCAVGFELNLPRLALLSGEALGNLALLDVLVFSTGNDPMVQEKMSVASDLWSSSIKADFLASPNPSPDVLVKACKKLGISWFVILREHTSKGQYGTVKIRDVEKRQEVEVFRTELCESLLKMMSEKEPPDDSQTELHHSHHQPATPVNQSGLVKVHIFSGPFTSKLKPVQKSQISERALKAFSQIFSTLTPAKSIEIVAHELSAALVNRLVEVMTESEEVFRKAMEAFPGDREIGAKFRNHLRSLKERGDPIIPLYNYRDNTIQFIPLLK